MSLLQLTESDIHSCNLVILNKSLGGDKNGITTACIRRIASMHEIKIIELNVQPDHMHCVVAIKLSISPAYVLQILKGGSARLFFLHHKKAKLRYPKHPSCKAVGSLGL